jgi:hypothetical protein
MDILDVFGWRFLKLLDWIKFWIDFFKTCYAQGKTT